MSYEDGKGENVFWGEGKFSLLPANKRPRRCKEIIHGEVTTHVLIFWLQTYDYFTQIVPFFLKLTRN
jgi:hypothetical protein